MTGNFRPGNNTVAYRYRLPASWGGVRLNKTYPLAIGEVLVLSPQGNLSVEGPLFWARPPRTIDKVVYDSWAREQVPAGEAFHLVAGGIPVRQEYYLLTIVAFFPMAAGMVFWFYRKRLGRVGETRA